MKYYNIKQIQYQYNVFTKYYLLIILLYSKYTVNLLLYILHKIVIHMLINTYITIKKRRQICIR